MNVHEPERTGWCWSCGRACAGLYCDLACERRWEREQRQQAHRATKKGKRDGYGVAGSTH